MYQNPSPHRGVDLNRMNTEKKFNHKIALIGNPNTGKSSLFNALTGMRQQVGNFPGITVDKKSGTFSGKSGPVEIIDFPGTYSIYPRSREEEVVYDVLSNPAHPDYPELAVVVVDASNLERNLFIFTQIYDLNLPTMLVLNMSDVATRKGKVLDIAKFKQQFPGVEVVETNARIKLGINRLKEAIEQFKRIEAPQTFIEGFQLLPKESHDQQAAEAEKRYERIKQFLATIELKVEVYAETRSNKIDRILVHPVWGYLIFAVILLGLFQLIFAFASIPMEYIDGLFSNFSSYLHQVLPGGLFSDLISQGIVPGIGGIMVFVPQIALLFFFLSLLEESGYLARVVFIMDRLLRPMGLNGKSVVPLMSSVACAIPGIMATRTISNWKERLITILVAPMMSCSARIPVYTLLIALVIPQKFIFGFINLQGLVLFGLYFLGLVSALIVAYIMKLFIRSKEKSFLLLEMPSYRIPRLQNVGLTIIEKVKMFVVDAGKVILAISVLLWVLATFGPGNRMGESVKTLQSNTQFELLTDPEQAQKIASIKLENSYIGIMGKGIEPLIAPLGYDWKIGISLITSFAAREVFVGSLATIYAVHNDEETNTPLMQRLRTERRVDGSLVYTLATGISLMVFYVYAMQCMATMAVVKRETKSWSWPLIQLGFLGILAYAGAFVTYSILH
jgi:ferrous iron transport protein B